MTTASGNGKFVIVEALNPETVCDPQCLLVCALISLGVRQHPHFPFEIVEEEINGRSQTRWRWVLDGVSEDGRYETAQLIQWWTNEAWFAANPRHDLALVRIVLWNMAAVAKAARESVPRIVIRNGNLTAHIPASASPALRSHLIGKLEGHIPLNATFHEPASE